MAGDPPELPMAKHKVQGLHGLEHYELVNIGALQSSCELLGEVAWANSCAAELPGSQQMDFSICEMAWKKHMEIDGGNCHCIRLGARSNLTHKKSTIQKTFIVIQVQNSKISEVWPVFTRFQPIFFRVGSRKTAQSVTVDTMLQHRRQRELKDRLKRQPKRPETQNVWPWGNASHILKTNDIV